ncbi:MAG: CoA transferase, partial [Chloroflexi bacterium]|nr:CoA transferase [Chloroflexota bacterium]
MAGPLTGTSVLEIASFITGPYAAQMLADLGASVIKIEDPNGGDPYRAWAEGGYSANFVGCNRSKRSLALNLRAPGALDVVDRLIGRSDVLLQNFRPGVADRLGIGYQRLSAMNPRLVYCSITGMGATGPYAGRPSYDTVGQGLSGLLSMLLDPEDPRPVGPAFSDSL